MVLYDLRESGPRLELDGSWTLDPGMPMLERVGPVLRFAPGVFERIALP
jgi:hypothetical protein